MTLSRFVREQDTETVAAYRRRVDRLAAIYLGIFVVALAAIVLIVVRGRFFVTIAQRSNVETATLAFVLVLFTYFAVISAPGAWGALRIFGRRALRGTASSPKDEQRKHAGLRCHDGDADSAYLNCVVCAASNVNAPIEIPLADAAGSLGTVVIKDAMIRRDAGMARGSNSIFAFLVNRIDAMAKAADGDAQVEIVQWSTIDDEAALSYASLVKFARNLERHLDAGPLWPMVALSDADLATLRAEAASLCPTLRDEALLPDVEFEAEHRLPIIPEPLGFIALSRREQRADPVASMGCALLVTIGILLLLVLMLAFPPWVPSK